MMLFAPMKGAKISAIGETIPWIGSSGPQELICPFVSVVSPFSPDLDLGETEEDRLWRRPPFDLIFEPPVPARERVDEMPAFRALTRSLQYVVCPSVAPFSIGPIMLIRTCWVYQ